jgi:SAM-dependent methyltransferase
MNSIKNSPAKKLDRTCPICGNDHGDVLHTQRFALPESHPLPKAYDVVSCIKCGFVYADTTSCQIDYDRFYRDFSKYEDVAISSGGGGSEWDRQRLSETAHSIAGVLAGSEAAILDIGCANGGLLRTLRDIGFMDIVGIDPSPACVSHVSRLGIACYEGGLFDLNALPSGKLFDCIILSHVLEHVYDLSQAVANVLERLKPDGMIYVEVPDASRYSDFYVVPYYYFDCEHINHFDENSLFNLFQGSGCIIVKTEKKAMAVSSNIFYPAVGVFLRIHQSANVEAMLRPDFTVRESVLKYIALSANSNVNKEIAAFAVSGVPVAIWGAGSYTSRLIATSALGRCNIQVFIDKDSSKQGKQINGISIYSPQKLREIACPIIVCAALYSAEIVEEIRRMGLANPVVIA